MTTLCLRGRAVEHKVPAPYMVLVLGPAAIASLLLSGFLTVWQATYRYARFSVISPDSSRIDGRGKGPTL
jgi:hypothetical protein